MQDGLTNEAVTKTDSPVADRPTGRRQITRDDVMTAGQVADLLGVSKSTIESWARQGEVPNHKRGRRRFFLRWEIEGWLTRPL